MQRPTQADVKGRSRLLRERYPTVAEDAPQNVDLAVSIEDAAALVSALTGRDIGAGVGEPVPAELVPTAKRAVALKAEQVDTGYQADSAEDAAAGKRVRSTSAGPWSVSYFAPGELGMKNGRPMVDANSTLDEALWALMTQEKRDEFIAAATGVQAPAGVVTSFDYRRGGGGLF